MAVVSQHFNLFIVHWGTLNLKFLPLLATWFLLPGFIRTMSQCQKAPLADKQHKNLKNAFLEFPGTLMLHFIFKRKAYNRLYVILLISTYQ